MRVGQAARRARLTTLHAVCGSSNRRLRRGLGGTSRSWWHVWPGLAVTAEKPAAFLRGRQHLPIATPMAEPQWTRRRHGRRRFSSNMVAIIVIAGGLLGLLAPLLCWSSFSPYRRGGTVVRGCGWAAADADS